MIDFTKITFEQFCDEWLERRDTLALRSLRGEELSLEEQSLLKELNVALDGFLPRPTPLPKEVKEAMEEIKRLYNANKR